LEPKQKSFKENIKNSFGILLFKEKPLIEISNSEKATAYGFLTIALAGIAMAISHLDLPGLIFLPINLIVGLFVEYPIFHLIAKFILGGKATGTQYFRSLSNAFIIYWFTFIPIVGMFLQFIAGAWFIAINIFILHKVHKLSKPKAIILGLLPVILSLILMILAIAYFTILFQSMDFSGAIV
jgi:hypothetical protein